MAFKIRKEGDNYNLPVLSLICDDVSDLNIILEEVEELIPYSECYVINTSEKYVLNSLGEWKKINEGTGGGNSGEGGGSSEGGTAFNEIVVTTYENDDFEEDFKELKINGKKIEGASGSVGWQDDYLTVIARFDENLYEEVLQELGDKFSIIFYNSGVNRKLAGIMAPGDLEFCFGPEQVRVLIGPFY